MGGGARQAGERGAYRRGRGEDHYAKVLLEVEDAFGGATRQISLRVPALDAAGRLSLETRTLNVRIPKGVHEGQVIRLAGQGAPGNAGAPAGDLLLEVQFRPHPRFRLDGRDVLLTLPLAPWEAALGAVVPVELPHGELRVRVPEGAQSGSQLRVRGKGIPGDPPGDLLLELRVVLPPADTPKARQYYESMAREFAFDPRGTARK
jgi:curved DNA-binding protein